MNRRPMTFITTTRLPPARLEQPDAVPGRAGGKILGPQQSGMAVDELGRVLLVPDMIAGGDDIDAGAIELLADRLGDAEAAGGVLAIDHHEIELQIAAQARQHLGDGRASGTARPDRRRRGGSWLLASQPGRRDASVASHPAAGRRIRGARHRPPAPHRHSRSHAPAPVPAAWPGCGRRSRRHSPGDSRWNRRRAAARSAARAAPRANPGSGIWVPKPPGMKRVSGVQRRKTSGWPLPTTTGRPITQPDVMQALDEGAAIELVAHGPIGRDHGTRREVETGQDPARRLLAGERRRVMQRQFLPALPCLAPEPVLLLDERGRSGRGRHSRWHV